MHLEGRSDSTVSITEEEYEMLLMCKMQVETSQIAKGMLNVDGCNNMQHEIL